MCGITGIIGSRPVNASTVQHMTDLLAHRGPDDEGIWVSDDGKKIMGHRRLSIIDTTSGGHQPMERDQQVITYNGEIYNYVELRERLKHLGAEFSSQSDTEVLLAAYHYWGEDCLKELNGMFAFALYDGKKNKLFCARDRFGEKPFLFVSGINYFAFASEYKSLLSLQGVTGDYDEIRLLRFLRHPSSGLDDEQETIFSKIHQLLPSHSLTLDLNSFNICVKKYWDVRPIPEFSGQTQEDAETHFKELLTDSIQIRMRSDVPVGSCLSGGLDSGSIVCIAQAIAGPDKPYISFTGRFPGTTADEWQWAEKIVHLHHLTNHITEPTGTCLLNELDNFLWHNELPVGGTSQYAQWCVFRLAHENGVTVLLDGQGGDELLGGYEQYYEHYLAAIKPTVRRCDFKEEISNIKQRYPLALSTPIQNLQQRLPSAVRHRLANLLGMGSDFLLGLKPDIAHEIDQATLTYANPPDEFHPLTAALWKESLHTHLPVLLRYGDRNSMAHSREVRLPFCDHRLAELTLSLSPQTLMGEAQTKRVLRGAMKDILPDTIRNRWNKQGFLPPQAQWFREVLRDEVHDIIESRSFKADGIWELSWWRAVLNRFDRGEDQLASMLWRPFIYDAWKRLFLKKIRNQPTLPIFEKAS